jgi:endonuclease/exonuclease/phosphatase family metal-dependent hydrolase
LPDPQTDIRIGTFNLENLDDGPRAQPPLAQRLPVLQAQLTRMNADVLCLQEINTYKRGSAPRQLTALDRLLDGTPFSAFHRASTHADVGDAPMDKHNLVILSRFPIVRFQQYWHDLVPPPSAALQTAEPPDPEPQPIRWDRPLLYAAIELPSGTPLHVFNLHLRAPLAAAIPGQKSAPFVWKTVPGWAEGYSLAAMKRIGQALEARLAVDQLLDKNPGARIAVCGDFNADDYEAPSRLLRAEEQDTRNSALGARSLGALEHQLPATRRFTIVHRGRRQMLDHILVSRNLQSRCRHLEIHNEDLGDEALVARATTPPPDSFHAPVVATFALQD